MTQPSTALAPPDSPVPAPRATTVPRARRRHATACCTSASERARKPTAARPTAAHSASSWERLASTSSSTMSRSPGMPRPRASRRSGRRRGRAVTTDPPTVGTATAASRRRSRAVAQVVRALAHHELEVVARVGERRGQAPVGERPVPEEAVQVVLSVLKEDPDRLPLGHAHEVGVVVPAADVDERPAVAEHGAEMIRPLPRDSECADAAAADAAHDAMSRVVGEARANRSSTIGSTSSTRNVAYRSVSGSYSSFRWSASGLTNTPTVTGISRRRTSVSRTAVGRTGPSSGR